MKKRILSVLLAACLVVGLLPTVALAEAGTFGAFTVTYDGDAPIYSSPTLTLGTGTYTITGTGEVTTDRIVVSSNAVADITLNNVNIDVSTATDNTCAFDIMPSATVNMTLLGTNTLKSGKDAAGVGAAGLRVPAGASLTITEASTGSLEAVAYGNAKLTGAGIGGNNTESCGSVTIHGGTITAKGSQAQGGNSGAGIGGGNGGNGGTVSISGGVVTATGNTHSAGIGGGNGRPGGEVRISGGSVTATGGSWGGAGIGGSKNSAGGTVTITGGNNVDAFVGGAGIGGGGSGAGGTVSISGGSVTATGGTVGGAGIGGGSSSAGGTVTITGGSVKATGGNGAKAIGAGNYNSSDGTLKNGETSPVDVVLYTLTVNGAGGGAVSNTAMTGLTTTPDLTGYTYGTSGMKTDADGKLYVYLPNNQTAVSVATTSGTYNTTGTISGDSSAGYTATLAPIDHGIWVGTTKVTSANAANVLGMTNSNDQPTVTYDAASNTLTLNGASITTLKPAGIGQNGNTSNNSGGIFKNSGDLKIELVGNNTIDIHSVTGQTKVGGIFAVNGVVEIISDSNGGLTVVSAPSLQYSYGICGTNVTIHGCTVNATGGTSSHSSSAISAGISAFGTQPNDNVVIESSTVTATGGNAVGTNGTSTGIMCNKSINITSSIVTATGATAPNSNALLAVSAATLTDSTLTATGNTQALQLGSLTAADHVVTASTDISGSNAATPALAEVYLSNNIYKYVRLVHSSIIDFPNVSVGYNVSDGTLTGTTANMQYSLNGGEWQDCATDSTTGVTFIAGTVKVRQKDKPANDYTVVTIAPAAAAPTAPTISGTPTSDSITISTAAGSEYYISDSATADWSGTPTGYYKSTENGTHTFSGLTAATQYYIHVRVAATASALPSASTSVSQSTAATTPHSGGGGSSAPVPSGTPVIVDGKAMNIGTEKKSGDSTTVTVDQAKLGENISGASSGTSVVVPVSGNGAATASLMVQNIADMAKKGMTLTVQTGSVAYNLNTAAIDTVALSAAFPGADMSKVPFDVTVKNSSATVEGETPVLAPVSFTVTATYNGNTVSVDTFSAYVDRVIEVTAAQAAKITTAVVVNADGSTRHVPTNVVQRDGKWYAIINSRTNSTYALIQNEITFDDAKGKWYEATVNEMGSRKIIAGRGESAFDGDAGITRAEFSAILVRALGLPAEGTSTFADVPDTAWYSGAVATAAQYGIVAGKADNRFDPDTNITRQEAMLMLQKAAALTAFSGTSSALDGFADADSVGTWAQSAAKWSVGSGLIQGADSKLNPTAGITRAESAAIILRLLQKAGLVDVR